MDKETIKQVTEIAAKTILSTIPVGGTLITEVWNTIKDNSVNRRLEDWQKQIEERLSILEITLEDLGADEAFTTAILNTTEMALKVSENKKREYLANAVVNSIQTSINENVELIFIDLIGRYTVWHLQILEYFKDPKAKGVKAESYYMGSPKTPLFDVFPEFINNESIVDKIVNDLYIDGMINTQNLNVTMTSNGMVASRTTQLGSHFVDYISKS